MPGALSLAREDLRPLAERCPGLLSSLKQTLATLLEAHPNTQAPTTVIANALQVKIPHPPLSVFPPPCHLPLFLCSPATVTDLSPANRGPERSTGKPWPGGAAPRPGPSLHAQHSRRLVPNAALQGSLRRRPGFILPQGDSAALLSTPRSLFAGSSPISVPRVGWLGAGTGVPVSSSSCDWVLAAGWFPWGSGGSTLS